MLTNVLPSFHVCLPTVSTGPESPSLLKPVFRSLVEADAGAGGSQRLVAGPGESNVDGEIPEVNGAFFVGHSTRFFLGFSSHVGNDFGVPL